MILRGKRLGFSLAESRELFELWDETESGSERQLLKMLETLDQKKQQLETQLNDIQMAKIELDSAQARCEAALQELRSKKSKSETSHQLTDNSTLDSSLH